MGFRNERVRDQWRQARRIMRVCGRKKRYMSEATALRSARAIWVKGTGSVMEPYLCPECGAWHLGHHWKEEEGEPS